MRKRGNEIGSIPASGKFFRKPVLLLLRIVREFVLFVIIRSYDILAILFDSLWDIGWLLSKQLLSEFHEVAQPSHTLFARLQTLLILHVAFSSLLLYVVIGVFIIEMTVALRYLKRVLICLHSQYRYAFSICSTF